MKEVNKISTEKTGIKPVHNPRMDSPEVIPSQDLDAIKTKIDSLQKDIEKSYLEIGRLLLKAKEIHGKHGKWLGWVQENVDLSLCKVGRLMKVARWTDKHEAPVPDLTFTQAYILSRLTQKELVEFWDFINGKENVTSMSKRELEAEVRDFLKSKDGKSSAKQVKAHASDKDSLLKLLDQIRNGVSELDHLVDDGSDKYDVFTAEICELCQTVIQKLSPEDVESI